MSLAASLAIGHVVDAATEAADEYTVTEVSTRRSKENARRKIIDDVKAGKYSKEQLKTMKRQLLKGRSKEELKALKEKYAPELSRDDIARIRAEMAK